MPAVVFLLGTFAIAIVLAASLLAGASWPRRCPGLAIVLWQALGLGWGLAAVGALVGLGISGLRVARGPATGLEVTELAAERIGRLVVDGSPIGPFGVIAALRMVSLAAGIALLGLLVWVLAAARRRCSGLGTGSGHCSDCWRTMTPRFPARWSSTTRPRPRTACQGYAPRS